MSESSQQEQLPLSPNQGGPVATPSQTSADAAPKSPLYAQLNTSVRPLDRLRRPTRNDDADYGDLINDLNFTFNEEPVAEPTDSGIKPVTETNAPTSQPSVTKIDVQFDNSQLDSAPAIVAPSGRIFAPARLKQSKLRGIIKLAAIATLIAASTALGYAAASYFIKPTNQPTTNQANAQTEAEWKKAQAQWECTLKQYQAKQAAQTNKTPVKEVSCVK